MAKETPQEKFRRLSQKRLAKMMNEVRLLANLAGSNYKGTREDKDAVINTARKGIEELEYLYSGDKSNFLEAFRIGGKGTIKEAFETKNEAEAA